MERTVLYAEDDLNDITLVELILASSHPELRLRAVRDGSQAIAYLQREGKFSSPEMSPTPQLILLDVKMPKMSGMEALQWMRRRPELRDMPIVMISSSMQEVDVVHAYELGANAYLLKSAGYKTFRSTLLSGVNFFMNCAKNSDPYQHLR